MANPQPMQISFGPPVTEAGCGHVELGDGVALPDRFTVTITEEGLPECDLGVRFERGRPLCDELRLRAGKPGAPSELTGALLRRIRLDVYLRGAITHAAFPYTRERVEGKEPFDLGGAPAWEAEPGFAPWDATLRAIREARRQPRPGVLVSDDHLRQVEAAYRAAMAQGQPPTRAVMEQWHVARATASRWIARARDRGFLGAARQGVAGERTSDPKQEER
jgi:hypothetical protein